MDQVEVKRQTRKYKDILCTSGYGVIVFICWSFIKQLIYSTWFLPNNEEINAQTYSIATIIFSAVLVGICIATGLLANKYGKKDKKEPRSLKVMSIILSIFALISIAIDICLVAVILDQLDVLSIVSIIADVFFSFFVFRILFSVFKLKKLYKEADYER